MKKTLLATAIAGALGVTAAAQAATVYDQDGTRVDLYGRISMGIAGGGSEYNSAGERIDNGAEFVDAYSRLGLRLQHMVSSDLTAFGHLEWRFAADEAGRNGAAGNFDAFSETRQAYLGLRSNSWGTIQAGNFDSFYKDAVTAPFDVYIDRGLEFGGHRTHSRGDSIGYITPDLNGFQVFLQAKHYSNRGDVEATTERDDEIVAQGGVKYEVGGLRLAAGFIDDKAILNSAGDRLTGGNVVGNDEMRYGVTAAYQFTPEFSARLGFETRDNNDEFSAASGGPVPNPALNGYDKYGLGMTYAVNQWTFNADIYHVDEDEADDERLAWAAGAYYNISSNFDVFLELNQADQPDVRISSDGVEQDDGDDIYYLVGARYHF